jgi:plastocyanin
MRSRRQLSISTATVLLISLVFSISPGAPLIKKNDSHPVGHTTAGEKHDAPKPDAGKPDPKADVIHTANVGPFQMNFTRVPDGTSHPTQKKMKMEMAPPVLGRTTTSNLDSFLRSSPYVSNTVATSAARLSASTVVPSSVTTARPAQIVDVAVAPGASLSFAPDVVTINVGDTVRWTFVDVGHNVVSGNACVENNIFCSPDNTNCGLTASSPQGAVYSFTFTQAGTFNYFCSPHCFNAMTGSVVVNAVTPPADAVNSDFDGDAKTDFSVFRPSDGSWYILQTSNGGFRGQAFGTNGDRIAPADYDGDGKVDIAVFRPSQGTFYIFQSSNNGFRAVQFGISEDLPVPGDYDNDGKADIAVFRPSSGAWYRLNSSNGAFVAQNWGVSTDKPVLEDFDGDGKTDLAVYRPSAGTWYILQSSNGGFRAEQFGTAGDIPAAADYDNDNKADLAVYRPSAGAWFILQSSNGLFRSHQFGNSTDRPVPGDFEGDGKADVAVFRSSEGTFYILQSSNGAFSAQQWGTNGDLPSPGAFFPQ